ncbi:MAG: hypothetical protein V1914_03125 [archaeon]
MNLRNLVLVGAIGLAGCATTHSSVKRTCMDTGRTMTCMKEGNGLVAYNRGDNICSVMLKSSKGYFLSLNDFGCDEEVDYCIRDLDGVKDISWRHKYNNEKIFEKNADVLYKKIKKDALEVDKK